MPDEFAIRDGSGLDLIIKERERQISEEGKTPEHDANHTDGELAEAAACYAIAGSKDVTVMRVGVEISESSRPAIVDAWPRGWNILTDKRKKHDRLRRLTIAGALIAAEIDRIQGDNLGEEVTGDEVKCESCETVLREVDGRKTTLDDVPLCLTCAKELTIPDTAKEIVERWLMENGYDGLYTSGECGCIVGNIAFCCSADAMLACSPGYKQEAPEGSEHAFMVGPKEGGN